MNYTVHPAAECLPMVTGKEFDELVASIKANGLRYPIILLGNQIIDGRNRLAACKAAGVTPYYKEEPIKDPVQWVIDTNLTRRHLTTRQKAAIAADMADLTHGGNRKSENIKGSNDPLKEGGSNEPPSMSTKAAADKMGVSTASVKRAKQVKREDPAAHEAAKRGEKSRKAQKVGTGKKPDPAFRVPSQKSVMEELGLKTAAFKYEFQTYKYNNRNSIRVGAEWWEMTEAQYQGFIQWFKEKPAPKQPEAVSIDPADYLAKLNKMLPKRAMDKLRTPTPGGLPSPSYLAFMRSRDVVEKQIIGMVQKDQRQVLRAMAAIIDYEEEVFKHTVSDRNKELEKQLYHEIKRYRDGNVKPTGAITLKEDERIRGLLHPDRTTSASEKQKYDLAFKSYARLTEVK